MIEPAVELWGWAKTNRLPPDDPAFGWLSVVDHGLDVAATFEALVRGPFRSALLHVLGRDDPAAIRHLTALVGLHDLGKASWTFQGRGNGPTPLALPFAFAHHVDEACALLLHREALPAWSDALAPVVDIADPGDRALLRAVFSHHGRPRNGTELAELREFADRFRPLADRDPVELARQLVSGLPPRAGGLRLERPGLHWLMGAVNLADWLGSNAAWFPLRPERGAGFDRASAAAAALAATGLDRPVVDGADADDIALARTLALYTEAQGGTLRPVQAKIVAALAERPPVPGDVLVLEDETGGGKTLAAYLVHALLARRGLVVGITFCLPTRASAKAIHDGAERVYKHLYPPILALPGYDEALGSPLSATRGGDGLPWAQRSRHRFLVSPVAVGTVDQVLLGTLTVPYAHLRSCAVARNLLVVDEVHSSDPYMRELLAEAVARQRAQGGITLLMSATLGGELRTRLLGGSRSGSPGRHGFGVGTRPPPTPPPGAAAAPYPVLWRGPVDPVPLGDRDPPQKRVSVELSAHWPLDEAGSVARIAVGAARAGARVLVIRNTVALARATAMAVRDLAADLLLRIGGHPVCHHARYAAADRLLLDDVLRAALHPSPALRTGRGLVAVTTQTAEQSLDVDADLLVTDLVPADVLLQRIGRLHRNRADHANTARPGGFEEPRCVVLTPGAPEELLPFADPHRPRPNNWGVDRAYADVLALAATRELLGEGVAWSIPAVNRQLVDATTAKVALEALARRLGPGAEEALRRSRGKFFIDRELAGRGRFTLGDDPGCDQLRDRFATRSDGEAMTRLGAADVRLEFAVPFPSPFGNRISALTVPGHLALILGLTGDHAAGWMQQDASTISIRLEQHHACFVYDPLGLALTRGARP